jgi:Kef-type K+ transport system membrane component KefB
VNIYYVAAIWLGMALLASVVSIKIAVPAALVEIVIGALAGNIPGIQEHVTSTDMMTFLASLGSPVLTFLAGAEIDPVSLRGHWKASMSIGLVSFALPFLVAFGFCGLVLHWHLHAAEIGGVALSTTSVAVVYAVMVETGLNRQDLGKLILAGLLHHRPRHGAGARRAVRLIRLAAAGLRDRRRRIRGAVAVASPAGYQALGPPSVGTRDQAAARRAVRAGRARHPGGQRGGAAAYVAGLVVAGVFLHDRALMDRLRSIAFAILTPFFFLRAGTLISASALISGAGVIGALLLVKLAAKMTGVWPVAAAYQLPPRERTYATLLMATRLTFGSIAALFGLTHQLISKTQYTELVTVVILSAFVPTLIAQQLFQPAVLNAEEEEALGEEDLTIIHRRGAGRQPRRKY